MEQKKRRSGFLVMAGLIGMIRPLLFIMVLAVLMGCAGNFTASFLTILGGCGLLSALGIDTGLSIGAITALLILFAVLRGVLRYAEQACNHYIAFRLLARLRHKVFAVMRDLCPAKLDGSGRGNLVSILTTDIELLEVFYAHTISPVVIAVLTSSFFVVMLGGWHPALGGFAALSYIFVGVLIPLVNGRLGGAFGQSYRNRFGELNTFVLDNLYGLDEILQFSCQEERMKGLEERIQELERVNQALKKGENRQRIAADVTILLAGIGMAALSAALVNKGLLQSSQALLAVITMMSSFGPAAALSSLSNNLHQTLASGNRVLDLLEESPAIEEIMEGSDFCGGALVCQEVTFSYGDGEGAGQRKVLHDFSASFEKNKIHGIFGKSGCGKSTLLKLMMRFYQTEGGTISYGGVPVGNIVTKTLRNHVSYVTQETFLFADTIANNIRVAKKNASMEEVEAAAKKASAHEFIMSLPMGYETTLAEFGDDISGGERQRIGIARAFLHNGDFLFLDEPTSNLDSLNEGIILESLVKEKKDRTVLLVSHRQSTMGIADAILEMEAAAEDMHGDKAG